MVPRKHCFLNIFGIPCFSDVFWQRIFLFFSLMHDVPSSSTMGNTHIWEMWDLGCYVHMSWHEHVQWGPHIYRRCGIWDVTSVCMGNHGGTVTSCSPYAYPGFAEICILLRTWSTVAPGTYELAFLIKKKKGCYVRMSWHVYVQSAIT